MKKKKISSEPPKRLQVVQEILANIENGTLKNGERIAQFLITPVLTPAYMEVDELSNTGRGAGGFGSTGK